MSSFTIISAKPNPLGKDRTTHGPIARQLLGEWVDLRNDGAVAVSLADKGLAHLELNQNCQAIGAPRIYWAGDSTLVVRPGESVRIHTGRRADIWQMDFADGNGATYHSYAEQDNFVLNNRCGDVISLWRRDAAGNWPNPRLDEAGYAANRPEGRVLHRQGNILV